MKQASVKFILLASILATSTLIASSQKIIWNQQAFELKNVTGSVTELNGTKVLKLERDLKALPFDVNNMSTTVDEPTYAKLANLDFENGIIEVKVLSQLQNPLSYEFARGFIGVAFRISENDSAFESIYLRPTLGRANNQFSRNHTIQYFAYPHFKFDRLRKESPGMYETAAPVGINEWITMRIEVEGQTAELYINDSRYSTFMVDKMKGSTTHGSIALWVDIGTIGYFKDLKVTMK